MAKAVIVCKKCKGHQCLIDFLTDKAHVKVATVGCQKICKGPVVGVTVAGQMQWFERVDKAKPMVGVAHLAEGGKHARVPKALEKKRLHKRAGTRPR
jgi:hypothetical protein